MVELTTEIADATRALQTGTASWVMFPPSRGAVSDCQSCCHGLQRSLAELASVMEGSAYADV